MKRVFLIVVLALAILAPALQAQQETQQTTLSSAAAIGPRDILEIKVFQDPSLNTRATVTDDGRINIPMLGRIDVSGLTPPELEGRLKALIESRLLNKADVTVQVLEAGSKPISVIGAVVHPGRVPATGNLNLIQAITQAGGLAPGYGRSLYVLRTASNGLNEQLAVDIADLMVNGNPDLNLPLRANDVVNVPVDSSITVYVLGEVMRPGKVQFRSTQHPTLLQALADAGGPTDRASRSVVLKRWVNGEEKTSSLNYKRIIDGRQSDVPLFDNDTIIVRESIF